MATNNGKGNIAILPNLEEYMINANHSHNQVQVADNTTCFRDPIMVDQPNINNTNGDANVITSDIAESVQNEESDTQSEINDSVNILGGIPDADTVSVVYRSEAITH